MRRLSIILAAALVMCVASAPSASAQQSVTFNIGGFYPTDIYSRSIDDVLVQNLNFVAFDPHDFRGLTGGGEYLFALGDLVDAGVGLGYYSRSVPAVYNSYLYPGPPVASELRLRIVPFTATFRFLPLGHRAPIVPYIGAGVGVFGWRYEEAGQFVDVNDGTVFSDRFTASGAAVGPVLLGGFKIPAGAAEVGTEIRWQEGHGDLPASLGFAGSRIDLGGFNYLFTIGIRF